LIQVIVAEKSLFGFERAGAVHLAARFTVLKLLVTQTLSGRWARTTNNRENSMKSMIIAALALSVAVPAWAQSSNGSSNSGSNSSNSNSNSAMSGSASTNNSMTMNRKSRTARANASANMTGDTTPSGTSNNMPYGTTQGGGTIGGTHSTQAQALGAAPGGQTGGTKSTGH
jgi:hypothetical protein